MHPANILPVEVWMKVFRHISDLESGSSTCSLDSLLKNLMFASRSFYNLFRPLFWETFSLDFTGSNRDSSLDKVSMVIREPWLGACVRHLKLRVALLGAGFTRNGIWSSDLADQDIFPDFAFTLIPLLTQVYTVTLDFGRTNPVESFCRYSPFLDIWVHLCRTIRVLDVQLPPTSLPILSEAFQNTKPILLQELSLHLLRDDSNTFSIEDSQKDITHIMDVIRPSLHTLSIKSAVLGGQILPALGQLPKLKNFAFHVSNTKSDNVTFYHEFLERQESTLTHFSLFSDFTCSDASSFWFPTESRRTNKLPGLTTILINSTSPLPQLTAYASTLTTLIIAPSKHWALSYRQVNALVTGISTSLHGGVLQNLYLKVDSLVPEQFDLFSTHLTRLRSLTLQYTFLLETSFQWRGYPPGGFRMNMIKRRYPDWHLGSIDLVQYNGTTRKYMRDQSLIEVLTTCIPSAKHIPLDPSTFMRRHGLSNVEPF
ncbi:hypothetical protein BDN72DRAFT_423785 [Pluteus cervinus]|uniref:Uncharacterized protein n=1 Tax=Pluteus cervinus TaxID=181527 RepID=A0ACD3A7Y4_9AGAR|nr:hypothetical protein BDN72DRAFT_423785 [Pluteus cervinus]